MLKTTTLLVIFACLTTAFAFNSTLTKSYFFVNTYNHLSYKLFHTANGIIAYNMEESATGLIPQYLLLDPVKGHATPILQDTLTSCGQIDSGIFDRLSYHVQTSTLVYFCTKNNSLLILDQNTYTVQNAIPTGISATFAEAKLTADGSSLYVLLMGTLYSQNQVPSQLVQIDLSTKTIQRTIIFDKELKTNEYVNGFVSQNNEAYALTNTINSAGGINTVSIYSVTLSGSSYGLVQLVNATNGGSSNPNVLNQLYLIGDYLAMNILDDLYIYDKQGKTVSTYPMIQTKQINTKTVSYIPAIVAQDGSSDLYVLFVNVNLNKFTAESGTIKTEVINTPFDFQIAYGNQATSDLLFIIEGNQITFSITNLQNSQVIYSIPSDYDYFVLTNSTFGVLQSGNLQFFNLETNAYVGDAYTPTPVSLSTDGETLYFSQDSDSYAYWQIKKLDLTTLSSVDVQKYYYDQYFTPEIYQFKISDAGIPEFVALEQIDNLFTIVTQSHGVVQFNFAEFSNDVEYIVADYDDMSVYHLAPGCSGSCIAVSYYEFNGTGFTLKNTTTIASPDVSSYYANGTEKAFAFSSGSFKIIDLASGASTEYSFSTNVTDVSSLKDNAGNEYLILSDSRKSGDWSGIVTQPSLFDSTTNSVSSLPGVNSFTVEAGAVGACSYWVVDGFISSVGLVKFYDACNQEDTSIFSILQ